MSKYTYVTLLTNNTYVRGVLLLKESLRRVESQYPLLCLITEDVAPEIVEVLDKAGIEHKLINKIETPNNIMQNNLKLNERQALIWKYVLTKFQIFNLEEYEKIIFLDADLLINKNVDHCFKMPHMTAAVDGEYNNLWPTDPHFNTGFFVIEPNKKIYSDLVSFANNLDAEHTYDFAGHNYVIADQELLNLYYSNWKNEPQKHLNKYYNVFPLHTPGCHTKDVLDNAYFFHFVGTKPWEVFDTKMLGIPNETLSVLAWDIKKETRVNKAYEIAYTIIELSYRNEFKDLDWTFLDKEGYFNYFLAQNCLELFRDFKTANEAINDVLTLHPDYTDAVILKSKIEAYTEASNIKPLVLNVLKEVYNKANSKGTPTLDLQIVIGIMSQIDLDTEFALNTTLKYWNIITGSVDNYLKGIYNQGRWDEINYR